MAVDATSIEALATAEAAKVSEVPPEPSPASTEEPGSEPVEPSTEVPPEPSTEEPPEPVSDGEPTSEPDDLSILGYMKETHSGLDYEKYQDDEAFLKGSFEAMQAMGRRDEDARLGKQLRGANLQPDQLEALLKGQTPATPAPKEPDNDKPSNGQPEWDPAWATVNDKGEVVPTMGAPKDVTAKYQAYWSWREQRLTELAKNSERFSDKRLDERDKALEAKIRDASKAETARHQQNLDIQALAEKHRNLLHVDGDPAKGLSAEGHRVEELFAEYETDFTNDLARLRHAIKDVQHDQPKPPPRRPRGKAVRQAGVASVAPEQKTVLELIESGVSADGSPMGIAEAMEKGVA